MIGIYKIQNKYTEECYIGQSVDIERRWRQHRANLDAKGKLRRYPLYRDMRRYGLSAFTFEVLEECSRSQLNEREDHWITYYAARVHCYNRLYPEEVKIRK